MIDIDQELTAFAMDVLIKKIANDPEYRFTWSANIAMSMYDTCLSHQRGVTLEICNQAAENFLNLLCKDFMLTGPKRIGESIQQSQNSIGTPASTQSNDFHA